MHRRTYLTILGVGASGLAGCKRVQTVLQSEQYESGDKEGMLPDELGSKWPDPNLQANHDLTDSFERVWTTPDESVIVLMAVTVSETVDAAKEAYERMWATAAGPIEYPLADEGMISDGCESAECVFRHSNAVGEVGALREAGLEVRPDRTRATRYAELLFEEWQE